MKVRISYLVDVDDEWRRVIAHHLTGEKRLATRAEIQQFHYLYGQATDELVGEHGECCMGSTKEWAS